MPHLQRLLVAFAWCALSAPAFAVDLNSTIKGVITDSDGLPVPNAEVKLQSPDLQGERVIGSDGDGRYRFTPLPPGLYTVIVEHPGFATFTSPQYKVPVATTIQVDIELLPKGSAQDEVTIVGAAPAVNTENVGTGAVLDYQFLKDIPTGRDYQSATQMAPGVVGGGNPNVHGGFDSSNQFYIDGVNITDPMTNTFSMNMNYDAIESVQVLTGGMDAEYGRSLGGAVNIVTKSGGNEFEGQANLLYHKGPSMILAKEVEAYGDRFDERLSEQAVINLGGPILKDKVWFFTSFQGDRYITNYSFDNADIGRDLEKFPLQPRNWRSLYWFGKVTTQLHPDHRLWVNAQGDPTFIDNVEQSPFTLPSGETIQNQGGWLGSLGHQWTPSERVILETQVYHQNSRLEYFPILWKNCDNQFVDENGACTQSFVGMEYMGQPVPESFLGYGANDFSAGEYPYAYLTLRQRSSLNSSLTIFGDLLGEHQFKVGVQAERLHSQEIYPGLSENGFPYYTYNPELDPQGEGPNNLEAYEPVQLVLYENDFDVDFTGTIFSWYAQDVYKPTRRLTLRPGLRFDLATMYNEDDKTTKAIEKPEPIISNLTVAPRMGAAFDLTGDGKTSLHAFYGRFYDSGFLILSSLLQRTSSGQAGYGWDPEAGDWDYENPQYTVADQFLRHGDLKNPYSDEVNVGLSRQIGPGAAIDVTVIYEESRRFWEDDEVNLIWDHAGDDVIGYRNGKNEAIYRLRTPDDVFTQYTSIETSLRKSYGDHWGLLASYVWSRSYGTNSGDQATAVADIPEQRPYEIGLLAYDQPHVVKASGSYTMPSVARVGRVNAGYVLGWNWIMSAGQPYQPIVQNNYYGGFSNYTGPNLGEYRLPAVAQMDVRAGLHMDYDDRYRWMVGVDIFNLFNDRTVTAVNWAYDPEQPVGESSFGDVLARQSPRWMQLTLRGEF